MQLRQAINTGQMMGFAAWQLADGTLLETRLTQAEYDVFTNGAAELTKPFPDAEFLMAAGGLPEFDTPSGFLELGDFAEINGEIFIQVGAGIDWRYFIYSASDPGNTQESNILGAIFESVDNQIRLPLTDLANLKAKNLTKTIGKIKIKKGGDISIPTGQAKKLKTTVTGKIPNHRSVTFDAGSGASNSYGTSVSWTHTVATQSNLYLAVGNTCRQTTTSSVTFNSASLSSRTSKTGPDVDTKIFYYDMVNPATGAKTVVVTVGTSSALSAVAQSCYGVDQTTPISATQTANGNSTAPSVTVSSASNGVVLTYLGWTNSAGTVTDTVDAGFTLDGAKQNTQYASGCAAHKTGAASVTRTDTLSATDNWALMALAVAPSSGGGATQQPDKFNYQPFLAQ